MASNRNQNMNTGNINQGAPPNADARPSMDPPPASIQALADSLAPILDPNGGALIPMRPHEHPSADGYTARFPADHGASVANYTHRRSTTPTPQPQSAARPRTCPSEPETGNQWMRGQNYALQALSSQSTQNHAAILLNLQQQIRLIQTQLAQANNIDTARLNNDLQSLQNSFDDFRTRSGLELQTVTQFLLQLQQIHLTMQAQVNRLGTQVQNSMSAFSQLFQQVQNIESTLASVAAQQRAHSNQLQSMADQAQAYNDTVNQLSARLGSIYTQMETFHNQAQGLTTHAQGAHTAHHHHAAEFAATGRRFEAAETNTAAINGRLDALEAFMNRLNPSMNAAGQLLLTSDAHSSQESSLEARVAAIERRLDAAMPIPSGTPQHQTGTGSQSISPEDRRSQSAAATPSHPSSGPRPLTLTQRQSQSQTSPPATFPVHDMQQIFAQLFFGIEQWCKQFATMPLSSAAAAAGDPRVVALHTLADQAVNDPSPNDKHEKKERRGSAKDFYERDDRYFLIAAIVNRIIAGEVFITSILTRYSHPLAAEFIQTSTGYETYWRANPFDDEGRRRNCYSLAALATRVIATPDFWPWEDSEVTRVTELILTSLAPLLPSELGPVTTALRPLVHMAFRTAVRMLKQPCLYHVEFAYQGDRYEVERMVVRGDGHLAGAAGGQLSASSHLVRLGVSPTVMEKSFEPSLRAVPAQKGQVLLALKKG